MSQFSRKPAEETEKWVEKSDNESALSLSWLGATKKLSLGQENQITGFTEGFSIFPVLFEHKREGKQVEKK